MTKNIKKVKKEITKDLLASAIGSAIDLYKIDETLAYDKGVPYEICGLTLYVRHAGAGNRDYIRSIQSRAEDHKVLEKKYGKDSIEAENAARGLLYDSFIESIIVGVSVDGQKQPYNENTKRQIKTLFENLHEKFSQLVVFVMEIDNYRASIRKDAEKN